MLSRLPGIPGPMEIMARVVEADQWAFETVARAKLRGCEEVLPRLSRIADHSVLWFVTAAGLAAAGGLGTRGIWPVPPGRALVGRTRGVESWPGGTDGVVAVINDGAGRGSVVETIKTGLPDAELIEVEDGAELAAVLDQAAG